MSYLPEPVTEKVSSNKSNDKMICGITSMQGWSEIQEDAYNCILDFDENTSLFAIYDGHGGPDVAQFCSQDLPNFLKNLESYKSGDIENALTETFLNFDAALITDKKYRKKYSKNTRKEEDLPSSIPVDESTVCSQEDSTISEVSTSKNKNSEDTNHSEQNGKLLKGAVVEEKSITKAEEIGDIAKEDETSDEDADSEDDLKKLPAYESGCTAVVALLRNYELYVANAGDSKCIMPYKGIPVDMCYDHKPEDDTEIERIEKADGYICRDGKIDGILNSSRGIGDHYYKMNKDLSDREQIVTAFPDVTKRTINPLVEEFMVLAGDSIWKCMTRSDVIDFVKKRLDKCDSLTQICEEMCDYCLSPNLMNTYSGCDNMTVIIVRFKHNVDLKRSSTSDEVEEPKNSKQVKTDENVSESKTAA